MIAAAHSAASNLLWHPHVHALTSCGGWDGAGAWCPVPYVDTRAAELLFRHKVLRFLTVEDLLSEDRVELLDSWKSGHTGFSAHNGSGTELTDVLAVVVRWYGGTRLGRGGLARAYSGATRDALDVLAVVVRQPTVDLAVSAPYARLGDVKRLVHPPAVELVSEEYGEESRLILRVLLERQPMLEEMLADLGLVPETV